MLETTDVLTTLNNVGEFTAKMRVNLSTLHLIGASRFADVIDRIERDNSDQPFGEFWNDIFFNATSVVFLTVACLEAFQNELFDEREPSASKSRWKRFDNLKLKGKFNELLSLYKAHEFDWETDSSLVEVTALISLRNGLTHFKPEWDDAADEHRKRGDQLCGLFNPSSFLSDPHLFPRAWASYDSARWAINTTIDFIQRFEKRTGSNYAASRFVRYRR